MGYVWTYHYAPSHAMKRANANAHTEYEVLRIILLFCRAVDLRLFLRRD